MHSLFAEKDVTMNNHHAGITPSDFASEISGFRVLSTNADRRGKRFVSAIEHETARESLFLHLFI